MRISRRRLAGVLLAATAAGGALYAASWSADWSVAGGVRVQSFKLDVSRFGLAPAFYWLADPDRLVLVPATLLPWGETATAGTADGEVLVVNLRTGESGWHPSDEVDGSGARHVFWSLPQHLSTHDDEEILLSTPDGTGPAVALSFSGFALSVPTYNANVPAFGEPGWHLQRRRFGRWRLTAGELVAGATDLVLTRTVLNSSQDMELSSLAAWLPGGRFLVLTPKTGPPTLLLAGPFQPASASDGSSIDQGQKT